MSAFNDKMLANAQSELILAIGSGNELRTRELKANIADIHRDNATREHFGLIHSGDVDQMVCNPVGMVK